MRQAYDYWQDQPGNYRRPGTPPPRPVPGNGATTAAPPPLGLLRKGRRPTFTDSKRPIGGRLAKPLTRVTKQRGSDGLASRSPAAPERSTATGSTQTQTYRLFACTQSDATPTALTAGAGRGATSPHPHAAAQPELPSRPGNASAATQSRTQHPGRTLGRATSVVDFTSTHNSQTLHWNRRAPNMTTVQTLCSPHSSLRTIFEFWDNAIPTRRTTDNRAERARKKLDRDLRVNSHDGTTLLRGLGACPHLAVVGAPQTPPTQLYKSHWKTSSNATPLQLQ